MPPEVFRRQPYNKSVDWWGLGVMVYQLLYYGYPFYAEKPEVLAKSIKNDILKFPEDPNKSMPISEECKDFMRRCMTKDQKKRIGYNDDEELLRHPWFDDIDINQIENFSMQAPIIPEIGDEQVGDVDNLKQKQTLQFNGSKLKKVEYSAVKQKTLK